MTQKSCVDCPSHLNESEVAVNFVKSTGGGACVKFGHVLGKQCDSQTERVKIGRAFAKNCSEYGKPRPLAMPVTLQANVSVPDADSLREGMKQRAENPNLKPSSCVSCKFLISEFVVYKHFCWTLPMCAAQGRLIFPQRLVPEADSCDVGIVGKQDDNLIDRIKTLPVYDEAFQLSVGDWASDIIDPQEYPSDREVTDEERALGIRAWRVVNDPNEYGPPVELPIFDTNVFDEVERLKVPATGSAEHPETYYDHQGLVYEVAVEWMELDRVPMLISEAGLGKTEGIRHVAWLMNAPFDRINFNKSTDVDSLQGMWMFMENETRFKFGRIPQRWSKIGVTLLDEPNRADTVIQEMLLPMCDNSKQLVLESAATPITDPETGEVRYITPPPINRHAFAFMAMAVNPSWDPKYHGTTELDQALIDRVSKIELALPPEDVEREILVQRYAASFGKPPSKKTLDAVMGIAKDLRRLIEVGSLQISWGIRPQIAVLESSRFYKLPIAYKRAVADYYEPEARKQILDVVKNWEV